MITPVTSALVHLAMKAATFSAFTSITFSAVDAVQTTNRLTCRRLRTCVGQADVGIALGWGKSSAHAVTPMLTVADAGDGGVETAPGRSALLPFSFLAGPCPYSSGPYASTVSLVLSAK